MCARTGDHNFPVRVCVYATCFRELLICFVFFQIENRIQVHSKTREIQLNTWANLVMQYQKSLNQPLININDEKTDLFVNKELNRRLNVDGRAQVMDHLERTAHATPLDAKKRDQWEIYWYTLDEWANMLYKWAADNAMLGQVCTTYELTSGDSTTDQEFHGLSNDVLLKALKRLEQSGKCELIDDEGVKFF